MWRCPECRRRFETACACGFAPRVADGIVDMTTELQRRYYDPVVEDYERRRAEAGWGGDDLDLPEWPVGHAAYWEFRRHSFRALDRWVRRKGLAGKALDVGSGNCWLTRHLDRWGFDATALDVNDGPVDGLRAAAAYLQHGDRFERVRGVMTDLPFDNDAFDLVVAADALHWTPDLGATLGELRRVVKPGGAAVIVDSPWFETEAEGKRRVADRVEDLTREPGLEPDRAPTAFLSRRDFDQVADEHGLSGRRIPVFFGWRTLADRAAARFYHRALARYPLVVVARSGRAGPA